MPKNNNLMMRNGHRVTVQKLRRVAKLPTKSTAPATYDGFLGQDRAKAAAELAASINDSGFNLFVAAPRATPVSAALESLLKSFAADRPTPDDWAYVFNFGSPHAPKALKFPAGKAKLFRTSIRDMIQDLMAAIPAAFDKPDIQNQRRALKEKFQEKQEDAFEKLGEDARERGVAIIRTPMGFSLAPMRDDKVLGADVVKMLSADEQKTIEKNIKKMEKELAALVQTVPKWEREMRDGLRKLERETVEAAITQSIEVAKKELCEFPEACTHLDAIRRDLVDNVALFIQFQELRDILQAQSSGDEISLGPFDRYDVNVLVDNSTSGPGAPVIEESHPTLAHLIGRVEHRSESGVLTTNFKLIKPGALHQANGGFLILDARRLLSEPMSWFALKRALQTGCIKTESLAEALNLTSTITLEPAPIPLSIKIILVGDPLIYHLLTAHDPEFSDYFKLLADFEHDIDRTPETEDAYAQSLRGLASAKDLLPLDKAACEILLEESARIAGDAERLSLATDQLRDLMVEANHRALAANRKKISKADIKETIAARDHRQGRIRDRLHDYMMRGVSLIETEGEAIGQINGLSVYQFGNYAFGKPNRITARTRPGPGRVIDIEREVRLGGPIHSKGVLILTGYLTGHYVPDKPLSLLASIVLEQSYGGVEGDSASLAELVALLSSLSGNPVRQSLAVTGAINQHGDVQAIGGANQKIEGFFDLCKARGLTGDQGVIVPASNVQHLMLRNDIVAACKSGDFHVFAVKNVDAALELLLGHSAEQIHDAVQKKLLKYATVFEKSPQRLDDRPAEKLPEQDTGDVPPDQPPADPPSDPPADPPQKRV